MLYEGVIFLCCNYFVTLDFLIVFRLLEANYRPKGVYQNARTILVIHNIAVQVKQNHIYQ